ncbi:Protein of unknown function [Alteromonadaceae bacterium Bs31]|nr:Protein of unknown function [Alteromonadaceae bacterium Bs31]
MKENTNKDLKKPSPSTLHLLKTAAAAAFGVQSKENLEEDFSQKSVIPYIIIGIVFTGLFVLSLIALVSVII